MDLTAAAEVASEGSTEIAQQGDVGDAELARPSIEPPVGIVLQPGNATTDLGITDQPVESSAASPREDEDMSVEIDSSEPETEQPSDRDPTNFQAS